MSSKRHFKFDKLVRDKVPDRMHEKNIHISYYAMNNEEYIGELKRKLLEESEEVMEANSQTDLIEELADVLEVVYALSAACDISIDQIEKIRNVKKDHRGDFTNKIYAEYIEIDSDHKDIKYYLSNPTKYPEII